MTPRARRRAEEIQRKLEHGAGLLAEVRASISRGDWEAAWAAGVKLRKAVIASRSLLDHDRHLSRVEDEIERTSKR